jgi:hypothetical protein
MRLSMSVVSITRLGMVGCHKPTRAVQQSTQGAGRLGRMKCYQLFRNPAAMPLMVRRMLTWRMPAGLNYPQTDWSLPLDTKWTRVNPGNLSRRCAGLP